MLNQIIIVGRLVQTPEVVTTESGKHMTYITVAIPRSYKNENGEYETDFIDCVLWEAVAVNTSEYCQKGDVIGVKGRIQTSSYETEDGNKKYAMEVVAEKISFLSSKKVGEENGTN